MSAMSKRMRRATLPEKLSLAAILLASCASDHHVSPWGARSKPSLAAFIPRPDLDGRLAAVDAETAALGLSRSAELRAELPRKGGTAVIRGYQGLDAAGRAVHAVRVATPHGVVMAVGPLDAGDIDRRTATKLVAALVGDEQSGAFQSGTDLNRDGLLDVVLRNEAGALSVWHVDRLGSGAYEIDMAAPPTRAADIDGDGYADLEGELPIAANDPIAPRLSDVATFEDGRYSNRSPAARAWHARAAAIPVPKSPDRARLRGAVEHAWHAILAGQTVEGPLRELHQEQVPGPLRAAFDRHSRAVGELSRAR